MTHQRDDKRFVTDLERKLWLRVMSLPLLFNPVVIKKNYEEKERQSFNHQLDLHGYTVQDAWNKVNSYIDTAKRLSFKEVVIITGKSGDICKEFPGWMSYRLDVRSCTPQNGGGAYTVTLK